MIHVPKITVILTSYNHAKYISATIDSVLDQTFEDFELIIWDDASDDESWNIIQGYRDARIRAFRNGQREGGGNINRALEVSRGKYIAVQHSDDLWEPNKLERQVEILDSRPDLGAVFTDALAIGEQGQALDENAHPYTSIFEQPNRTRYEWLHYFFYRGNALCHPSVLIRRECYSDCGKYRPGLPQLGDFDMWVRLCLKYEILVLPEKLVRFRVRADHANASGDRPDARRRSVLEFQFILRNFRALREPDEIKQVFPASAMYWSSKGFDADYIIARTALEDGAFAWAKAFGADLLFEIMTERPAEIESIYGFDLRQFAAVTGSLDPYSIETLHELREQLGSCRSATAELTLIRKQLEKRIENKNLALRRSLQKLRLKKATERDEKVNQARADCYKAEVASLRVQLTEKNIQIENLASTLKLYRSSISWRITLPLREAKRWVLGPREQFAKYTFALRKKILSAYQSVFPSEVVRAHHKDYLALYAPGLLTLLTGVRFPSVAALSTQLQLTAKPAPEVTVLITNIQRLTDTLRCLESIATNRPQASFELLIAASPNNKHIVRTLTKLRGVRVVMDVGHDDFGCLWSLTESSESSKYLFFLPSSSLVTPGWLDELINTFVAFPKTGIASPKMVAQEEIEAISNGLGQFRSSTLLLRHRTPGTSFVQRTACINSHSFLITAELAKVVQNAVLGSTPPEGLLYQTIHEHRKWIVYQPLSTITVPEVLADCATHHTVCNDRDWSLLVKERDPDKCRPPPWLAPPGASRRHALVIDHFTPTPDRDAGSITTFKTLCLLRDLGFAVTFMPAGELETFTEYTKDLQRAGIEALYAPHVSSVENHLCEAGARYELVLMFRPIVAGQHAAAVRKYCPYAKTIYHTVDLHYVRMNREAVLRRDSDATQQAAEMKKVEQQAIRNADIAIVHSTTELDLLASEISTTNIRVFPLILDIPGTKVSFEKRQGILFIGGFQHAPNIDAVMYFANEIMPIVRKLLPEAKFHIVGSAPPPHVLALAQQDVIVHGFVEDLRGLMDTMKIAVAPLRYGAGIKGKIGTAMASGLPNVATTIAVEGMMLNNGSNVIVADEPSSFATEIARLHRDEILWNELSRNGIAFAEAAWGIRAGRGNLSAILADIGIPVPSY